ncbi:armadillo-type protein [Mycena crocata]|nr:armadillo-type protein [Mycena crocata]
MEIYASYLGSRYVSDASKIAILTELRERAEVEDMAETIIMPPLTRQATHESLLSWWSDSNAPGATFSLHAAAKPLMKWMYHRDVLKFIKRQQGIPLSVETMGICSSYLEWKYVSDTSKIAIYVDLLERAEVEAEGQVIVTSGWLSGMVLRLEDVAGLSHACSILAILAQHESTIAAVLEVEPDGDDRVMGSAVYALSSIACDGRGAQAVVDAGAQELASKLLDSRTSEVRCYTCWMLGRLARQISTAAPILAVEPCPLLVAALNDIDLRVVEGAIYALSQITGSFEGAQAVVKAAAEHLALELLQFDPTESEVVRHTCCMLGHLAEQDATVPLVLAIEPDSDMDVVENAIYALSQITCHRKAAEAAVTAGAQDVTVELLDSQNSQVRRWACYMLGNIAMHDSMVEAVLSLGPDSKIEVVENATSALSILAYNEHGAEAVVNSGAQDVALELLSSNHKVRIKAFVISPPSAVSYGSIQRQQYRYRQRRSLRARGALYALAELSRNKQTGKAILETNILNSVHKLLTSTTSDVVRHSCRMLGNLAWYSSTSRDENVVENATYVLVHISNDPQGAKAVLDARALDFIAELLQSPNNKVRTQACHMLANLAHHSSTSAAVAVVAAKPCLRLVSLLRDIDGVENAILALARICKSPNGAMVVLQAP